ncbi:MAG: flagellar M-ring protein FliF, partial [Caulobacteraceae bacterium]
PGATPAGSTNTENAETTNYEISKTTTTTTKEPGEVKKLAVAVAVDGKWTPAADGKGEPTYAPRTAEEIAQIKSLVAAAAGIVETRGDKIEVINVRFNHDTGIAGGLEGKSSLLDFSKNDIMRFVELGILTVVALLLIFFVLRPLLKSATGPGGVPAMIGGNGLPVTSLQTTIAGGQAQLAGPEMDMDQRLDIARIEGQVKASSVKKVADFVQAHPDDAAGILRTWVAEG